ncbi:MAG: acyltransferase [Ginsengibacter sp.]
MSSKLSTGAQHKLYFPQLDSVRGISFIAIFLFHAVRLPGKGFFLAGFINYLYENLPLGLEVFFVLSSFLLTYLGLSEYKKRNSFSFKNYFTRRILRIWPLYYFILLLAFIVSPFIAHRYGFSLSLPNPWYYIFFISNFYIIDHVFFLRFLWTISVEEQFYLLWGISLRFFYKKLPLIIGLFFLISITFSVYATLMQKSHYLNSLTYLFDFACGALAAIAIFRNRKLISWIKSMSRVATAFFYSYLVFHFIIFYFLDKNTTGFANNFSALLSRYLFIIYTAFFIIEQVTNNERTTILEKSRFLVFTGKLSYGLYCYHGITITFINLLLQHFGINIMNGMLVIIYFTVNYFIAIISYNYLELPFLRLKNRWRRI